jgi:hypothetical protein
LAGKRHFLGEGHLGGATKTTGMTHKRGVG